MKTVQEIKINGKWHPLEESLDISIIADRENELVVQLSDKILGREEPPTPPAHEGFDGITHLSRQLPNVFKISKNGTWHCEKLVGYTAARLDSPDTVIDVCDTLEEAEENAMHTWPDQIYTLFKMEQIK